MTVPGPSGRIYTIDDHTGAAVIWTPLVVGEPSGIGELEESLSDFTGPHSVWPAFLPSGFTDWKEATVTFQADYGGVAPADPIHDFWVNRGASRLFAVTFAAGWTFSCESYVSKVAIKCPPKELTTIEVTFRFTGVGTIT